LQRHQVIAILLGQGAGLQPDQVRQRAASRHRLQIDQVFTIVGDIRFDGDIGIGFVESGDHRLGGRDHRAPGAKADDHLILGEYRRAHRQDEQDRNSEYNSAIHLQSPHEV